jgi:NAD(P)-dependent dehydrogenase (short-subunit alcohol dehydrogenase family)
MKLDGKISIVTGGGRGIGRAIALRFASEGAAVVVAGTTIQMIEAVAQEISNRGGRAIAVSTDVASEADVAHMVSTALSEFGGIDILVNNAGIAGPTALVQDVSREDWDHTLAVNLTGAFLCAKHALPHLIERRAGRIINITSIAGLRAYALRSPYAASKWAMIGLTRTLAEEAGRYDITMRATEQHKDRSELPGITVNAIAPGPIQGERIEAVISNRAAKTGRSIEQVQQEYLEPIALGRMAEEDDIAAVAVFLASDEARNITGQTIDVSAGYRL